jgi:hypothetical protein
LQERIDHFYEDEYPKLRPLTSPIPEAVRLVEWAFEQGHRVVIATDPVFPLIAVQHRLHWAGLPPEKYPFALVTSYENFHFTKAKISYYPEVLAQLGWPERPVVMVGDNFEREVKPSLAAGLPIFWVRKPSDVSEETVRVPQGSLKSFRNWLEKAAPDTLNISFESSQALLATLRSTPAGLATLISSSDPDSWKKSNAPSEWNINEIICHLCDVEREISLPWVRQVLTEENPSILGELTDAWLKDHHHAELGGRQALDDFTLARKETLTLLDNLQAEWSRPARHAIYGQITLQGLIRVIADHDRTRVQQVWKMVQ